MEINNIIKLGEEIFTMKWVVKWWWNDVSLLMRRRPDVLEPLAFFSSALSQVTSPPRSLKWPPGTIWNHLAVLLFRFYSQVSWLTKWVWVNTYRYIFSGMNIHLPAILGFTRYQGFDPSPNDPKFADFTFQLWSLKKIISSNVPHLLRTSMSASAPPSADVAATKRLTTKSRTSTNAMLCMIWPGYMILK